MNTACQMCGKDCEINQEVKTGMTELKLWCYCKECDTETFHEIGTEKPTEKRNIMTELNYPIEVLESDAMKLRLFIGKNESNAGEFLKIKIKGMKKNLSQLETAIKILKENNDTQHKNITALLLANEVRPKDF